MKDIKGYEGLYAITSCGKVWSYRKKKFMSQTFSKDGYLRVMLCVDGQHKTFQVHRLVAEAYIPNPEGKPQVNHKDEVKTNNCVNNLEWITIKENVNYGTRTARAIKKLQKPVYCVELDKIFPSLKEAGDAVGVSSSNIGACLRGKQRQSGGYHWRDVEKNSAEQDRTAQNGKEKSNK